MSFNGFGWLRQVRDAGASAYELSVATALAIRADEDGTCWPSVETLAKEAGLSQTRARQSLKWLTEQGLLRTRGDQPSKGRISNTYMLQPITRRSVADHQAIAPANPAPGNPLPSEPIAQSRVQPIATQPVAPQPVAWRTPTPRPALSNPAPGAPKCTQELTQELTHVGARAGARDPAATAVVVTEASPEAGEDTGRATTCPLDLLTKAEAAGVFADLAVGLPAGLPELRHHAHEFVTYWTIGKGMGRRKALWMRELRGRLTALHFERRLVLPSGPRNAERPPGAIDHDARLAADKRAERERDRMNRESLQFGGIGIGGRR